MVEGDFAGVKLEVIAAACDDAGMSAGDPARRLEDYLADPLVPGGEKAEALLALPCHTRRVNAPDMLLHDLCGRYIWLCVALHPAGDCDCELTGLRLELPRRLFTSYFPEIYHGNDFFDRYIAVFQSLFLDVERLVDRVPALLDYRTTPEENLPYLAGWLGYENEGGLFSPLQLRRLIERIDLFQGAKGTRRAMEEIILLYTGIRPRIVEHFQWAGAGLSAAHTAVNERLYGESADHFCVILDLTGKKLAVGEQELERLIEDYSVLGTRHRVVYLDTCSRTDTHCYLDINSALSVPEVASMDGTSFGDHITAG